MCMLIAVCCVVGRVNQPWASAWTLSSQTQQPGIFPSFLAICCHHHYHHHQVHQILGWMEWTLEAEDRLILTGQLSSTQPCLHPRS
jgi:hypothetical protein